MSVRKTTKNRGESENASLCLREKVERVCLALAERGIYPRRRSRVALSTLSPMGIGGVCDTVFYPETLACFTELICELRAQNVPYAVLGTTSNVLIPDTPSGGTLRGVIVFTRRLTSLAIDGENVFAFCGVTGAELICRTSSVGLTGAEFLTGIPCTVGGATYMNAGAFGRSVSDIVESVLSYVDGTMEVYSPNECAFSYKNSVFMQNDAVILGTTFRLKRTDARCVCEKVHTFNERRLRLPQGKSLGCIFKNPTKKAEKGDSLSSAGALIESVGMKGVTCGGARVSEKHANFIINENGATYDDVVSLIAHVKSAVLKKHGVSLTEEIRYLDDLWSSYAIT